MLLVAKLLTYLKTCCIVQQDISTEHDYVLLFQVRRQVLESAVATQIMYIATTKAIIGHSTLKTTATVAVLVQILSIIVACCIKTQSFGVINKIVSPCSRLNTARGPCMCNIS